MVHVNVLSFDFSYTIRLLLRQMSVFVWSDVSVYFLKLFKTIPLWFIFILSVYSVYPCSTRRLCTFFDTRR